ncbi:MAG: hypothetical protein NW226_01725 [Microscillaceae bacterium]|nr:hypothetical protein [Microscillaceae bacterium]
MKQTFIQILGMCWLAISLNIGFCTQGVSQEKEPEYFDKATWQKLTKNLDYTKETPSKKADTKRQPEFEFFKFKLSDPMKVILFTGLIVVLAFLVIWIVSSNTQVKIKTKDFKVDFLENAQVTEISIETLREHLEAELKSGNYRVALRIYYLLIIKTLHDKGLILWKKEKTNRQYILELKGQPHDVDFAYLTRTYEMIWYGDKFFEPTYMQESCHSFEKFLNNLDQKI